MKGVGVVEIIPMAVILLVSAIPVALPTLSVITTAPGSSELAKMRVPVTILTVTGDAATADTLCVDRTGTHTINRLEVADTVPATDFKAAMVCTAASGCRHDGRHKPVPQRLPEDSCAC